MKPFEIPYNFDFKLIDFLRIYNNIEIHSIYIPPYKGHYLSAKSFYMHMSFAHPLTLKDYERHIEYINKYFPNKVMLLLQQTNQVLDNQILKYYINLGITKFCVGSIEQASNIRQILPNAEIIGSITMKIDQNKLQQKDYSVFNGFVLWFPFNRNLPNIKNMPKKYFYILLVNCGCSIYCDGSHHWLAASEEKENKATLICPRKKDSSFEHTILIPPQDLYLFEPYITYIKLQGREYSTNQIISDIVLWTNTKYNLNNLNLKRNYNIKEIYNII